jgi:AbrB family looped-hinge helix DNA binding protein
MSTTTLTSKGQITLTKAVRDRLSLKQGDTFQIGVGQDGSLTLTREQRPSVDSAFGALHRLAPRKPPSLSRMRAAVLARARRKHAGKQE